MSLDLVPRSLRYFEKVAQLGSIQAASRELRVSASAIHRQITAIEDALGELLFEREAKGMTLTPAGYQILEVARDWRLDNARLWSVIQADRGIEQGQIRFAAMDGMVNGIVPELINTVAERFPRLQISVEIASPDTAFKGILNGEFDFAIVVNAAPDDNVNVHWSHEFPLGCIAAPTNPVATRHSIALSEVITHPVVFQSPSLPIRKLLEARHKWVFEGAKNPVIVNSIQLLKQLVATGRYVALTSALDAGPEIRSGQLVFVPIRDDDVFSQKFAVVSNIQIPETPAVEQIIALAIDTLKRHTRPAPSEPDLKLIE